MLNDFIDYVIREWAVISKAPATFVVASIVVAAIIWLFARSLYSGQIASLNERIKLRDDQLGDLQKKLHAVSPSDALIKIGELTGKVEALSIGKWDALTSAQTDALRERLKRLSPTEIRVYMSDDARALGYALDKVLDQDLGWKVNGTRVIGGDFGIEIYPRSEIAETLAKALRECAGIDVSIAEGRDSEPLTLSLGERPY